MGKNKNGEKRVFNILHLTITLKNGKITKMSWDAGCEGCEKIKDACTYMKTNYLDYVQGKAVETDLNFCSMKYCTDAESTKCDLKVRSGLM